MIGDSAKGLLEQEALALRARLLSVRPFSMHMPMVSAAAVTPASMSAIERHMKQHTGRLHQMINRYLHWLRGEEGKGAAPSVAQRKLTLLRLHFTAVLTQFDIFAEAITQRSEHDYGVWLSGLDVLADDALLVPGAPYASPPLVCYLDRGIGAAIRRYSTPLPGGATNPVSIIRVPRERMIGSGIAASIVHECGHQAAALLDLVSSLQHAVKVNAAKISDDPHVSGSFVRWMPEIVSDFWSVGKLGIGATLGVLTVVSLPRPYVVSVTSTSTHPTPWIRVKLSAAMGNALYPHMQWEKLSGMWEHLYPLSSSPDPYVARLRSLERALPALASLIAGHRPSLLAGRSLQEIMPVEERRPELLRQRFAEWAEDMKRLPSDSPTMVFAVMGQAKFDGRLAAQKESELLNDCLRRWALHRALDTGATCAVGMSAVRRAARISVQG